MREIGVWVLASARDPGLHVLDPPPPGTRFLVGGDVDTFRRSPFAPDAVFVCSGRGGLLESVWPMASGARWVHSRSAGLEHVLFPALVESSVPLTNARGVFSAALGEWTLAAILFFAKDLRRMVRSQEKGVWEPFDPEEVAGKRLGIVGYGDIGRAVAGRLRPLGLHVTALRRRPELSAADDALDEVLPASRLLDLMSASDYVAVAAPLTPGSRGLVGEAELSAMKPSGVLINVGRGPVVDEGALVRALQDRRIRGAALDVFETEPLPAGHPFYRLDNVLLSPHCADHTPGWLERAMVFFLENLERFRRGEPLANVVDKRLGY